MECWGRARPFPCIASGRTLVVSGTQAFEEDDWDTFTVSAPSHAPLQVQVLSCHATAARCASIDLSCEALQGEPRRWPSACGKITLSCTMLR